MTPTMMLVLLEGRRRRSSVSWTWFQQQKNADDCGVPRNEANQSIRARGLVVGTFRDGTRRKKVCLVIPPATRGRDAVFHPSWCPTRMRAESCVVGYSTQDGPEEEAP